MDGPALSGRERRLLAEIECDLSRDSRLDRRLSTMGAERPHRVGSALRGFGRRLPTGVLMTALVMAALCLSIAVRKPTAVVAIATAAVWVGSVMIAAGLSVVLRRHRRHRVDPADGSPDRGDRWGRGPWPGEHRSWGPYRRGDGRADGRAEEPGDERGRRERRPWDHPEA
ncbi:hypothetical protein [Kitasatospora purpeofusca]|uniref:hypothetical protein n=1 Tax=Kitasatospora purpeofusca TaxID=67352 RepID=UPI00224E8101|nr:hypothetical protein [Kitasatospora purpeofusca]MCX4689750.1 DUF3040 domain-containing protein [Kitasatospora purpeofusca]